MIYATEGFLEKVVLVKIVSAASSEWLEPASNSDGRRPP